MSQIKCDKNERDFLELQLIDDNLYISINNDSLSIDVVFSYEKVEKLINYLEQNKKEMELN